MKSICSKISIITLLCKQYSVTARRIIMDNYYVYILKIINNDNVKHKLHVHLDKCMIQER